MLASCKMFESMDPQVYENWFSATNTHVLLPYTVNSEITVAKKFCLSPSTTKIKPSKFFLQCINGVSLYGRVVIAPKIKPGEILQTKYFTVEKLPNYCILPGLVPYKWKYCRALNLPIWLQTKNST